VTLTIITRYLIHGTAHTVVSVLSISSRFDSIDKGESFMKRYEFDFYELRRMNKEYGSHSDDTLRFNTQGEAIDVLKPYVF
jgi:hypothetical protein